MERTLQIIKFSFILIILLHIDCLVAQNAIERISYGLWSSSNFNIHSADFNKIPDCPSCSPGYHDGTGFGIGIGAKVDIPISDAWLFSGMLFYKSLNAELISKEPIYVIQQAVLADGAIEYTRTLGEFEHSMDTKFSIIGLEPSAKYNVYDRLFVNFGFQGAIIVGNEYSQIERITKPNSGTFMDGVGNDTYSRERNRFAGTIKSANSIYLASVFSLSYQLPVSASGEWILEPELSYTLGFTDLVSDQLVKNWKANSLGLGIALKYSPKEKEPLKDEYKRIENTDTLRLIVENIDSDTITKGISKSDILINENDITRMTIETISRTDTIKIAKKYNLSGDIEAVGVDSLNNEIPNPKFRIEEFVYNRMEPLLNYIFFDNNSAQLLSKYKILSAEGTTAFAIDSLKKANAMEIHYQILNIIGRRLTDIPSSNLTIVGCNSDMNEEQGNIRLSTERANNVRDYFVNTWNINPQRLKLEYRNLPNKASIPKTDPDKIQENQRVELYANDYNILKYIFICDTNRVALPSTLRLKTKIDAEAGLTNWKVSAIQKSDSVNIKYEVGGTNEPIQNMDWVLGNSQQSIPRFPEPIQYTLRAKDNKNKELLIRKQTPPIEITTVQGKRVEKQDDYEIERFSLILFDFDKAEISNDNQKFIDYIKSRIQESSVVDIIGYTDRTGDKDYNLSLAKRRAAAVQKLIGTNNSELKVGEIYLFDNESPEGRLYCRTVRIIVKTKIKN